MNPAPSVIQTLASDGLLSTGGQCSSCLSNAIQTINDAYASLENAKCVLEQGKVARLDLYEKAGSRDWAESPSQRIALIENGFEREIRGPVRGAMQSSIGTLDEGLRAIELCVAQNFANWYVAQGQSVYESASNIYRVD